MTRVRKRNSEAKTALCPCTPSERARIPLERLHSSIERPWTREEKRQARDEELAISIDRALEQGNTRKALKLIGYVKSPTLRKQLVGSYKTYLSEIENPMFYKNPCKNPRKRTKAKAVRSATRASAKAYAAAMKAGKGFNKKVEEAVKVYFRKLKKKLPKENPRTSFPKTSRGRKPKVRGWVLEMYGAGGKKLGGHIIKRTKKAAEKVAASGVGKNFRGKRIHRVVLDGPH